MLLCNDCDGQPLCPATIEETTRRQKGSRSKREWACHTYGDKKNVCRDSVLLYELQKDEILFSGWKWLFLASPSRIGASIRCLSDVASAILVAFQNLSTLIHTCQHAFKPELTIRSGGVRARSVQNPDVYGGSAEESWRWNSRPQFDGCTLVGNYLRVGRYYYDPAKTITKNPPETPRNLLLSSYLKINKKI
jgi:hypothetical protein